ncbi:MAG: acetylxylan esterase [Opitutus sp.]|nr:acetylxylan esterase [Opitutus sp.]
MKFPVIFLALFFATPALSRLEAAAPSRFNHDESKVGTYTLPDALLGEDGTRVTDVAAWRSKRRGEILRSFAAHMYGVTPQPPPQVRAEVTATRADAVDGLATRTLVTLRFFDDPDAPRIHLMLYVPNGPAKPLPVFLGLNYYGNASVESDPALPLTERWIRTAPEAGVVSNRATEATRGSHVSRWPLAMVLRRGYAVATFFYGDIEEDHFDGWKNGLRGYLIRHDGRTTAKPDEWGALGAWGWGLSRALDYLETNPKVDARRVAVMGHSRHGKAALWAGAQDERFGMVISNNSGEGGASLARRDFGETIAYSIEHAAFRYCENFRRFIGRAAALPFDQHMLMALIAPRPLYVASATLDDLSDPRGEFLSAVYAAPVYRLFGHEGLSTAEYPAPDRPVGRRIGYHLRSGKHDITAYDWEQYLAFADRHFHPTGSKPEVPPR